MKANGNFSDASVERFYLDRKIVWWAGWSCWPGSPL